MERILLDLHCHLVPLTPAATEGLKGIAWRGAGPALEIDGYLLAAPSVYRVEALLDWMDRNAVERAWISVPPPLYRLELEAGPAAHWIACLNEGLAEVAARHPDRLAPLVHLPVQHPALAAETAQAWIARGLPRFAMPAGSANRQLILSDAAYDPLWQALDEAGAFLFLHPCKGCDPRYEPFYLHNLLGSPVETALAAAHLALSGILDRHRRMTLCLAHGGGATAAVAGRLERGQVTGRPGADTGAERPRQVFRRVAVDCICHDPATLALAAAAHGEDNLYFGSDWPFSMGLPEPHRQLADCSPDLRRQMFETNPRRLLARFPR
ncbi:aminocarboxymuconate-semialdehyde decarboxylase [Tistlia consotensis]|uniref:Aminocarboxymuconate-semialdehyde decarboxylase n=2 Tax=Tistlia TaxID=1321364 RepID=A0A1Y6CJN4_9PROT|nr:aminocarboxymuconate-semialdehyde decarboxylase [Tistlia consotensis USBA 355]SNS04782.1 aminocarboxymuconate-semialdehyde decarboxylase [Tistlia consotensis]